MQEKNSHSKHLEKKVDDDDIDYEKDILQFKQIWKQLKNQSASGKDQNSNQINQNQPPNSNSRQVQKRKQKSSKQTTPKVNVEQEKKSIKSNKHSKPDIEINHNLGDVPLEKTKPNVKRQEIKKEEIKQKQERKRSKDKQQYLRNPKNKDHNVINIKTSSNPFQGKTDILNQKNNQVQQLFLMKPVRRADQIQVFDLKQSIEQKNQEIALLRISNNRYHDKISHLQRQIQKRDKIIESLKIKQMKLQKDTHQLKDKQVIFQYGVVQYQNFKRDTKRLLNMLKQTQQYKTFATLALQDNSIRFLHQANKKHKTNLDVPHQNLHFCTCNKAFIPEPALWVPDSIYKYARQFVQTRKGDLSKPELELMMYDLNKMWRERQKNIINSMNSIKAKQIGVLRRKLQNYRINGKANQQQQDAVEGL